jgi:hypothetical protein
MFVLSCCWAPPTRAAWHVPCKRKCAFQANVISHNEQQYHHHHQQQRHHACRYDRVLNLKQAAKLRDLALSSEQRAAKEDLERRENAAKRGRTDEVDAKRRLEAEVARLRAQGQVRLERERERVLREAEAEEAAAQASRERQEGEQVSHMHVECAIVLSRVICEQP